jgi:hypothetical protein
MDSFTIENGEREGSQPPRRRSETGAKIETNEATKTSTDTFAVGKGSESSMTNSC